MRPAPRDLPAALRNIATTVGLEYITQPLAHVLPIPIACATVPLMTPEEVDRLPVQLNFHASALDLDKPEDRKEYERVMSYLHAGYGMRLVHIERILVTKIRTTQDGKKTSRRVRRIFIEYCAPYRVILPKED